MADTKTIGKGTLVKLDPITGGTTYVAVGCIRETTPPGRERNTAEGTCIEDDLEVELPGNEALSEFTFMQFWAPKETNDEIIDSLFDSKVSGQWQITYPLASPVTDVFSGFVKEIGPEQIVSNEVLSRSVTVSRDSIITRTIPA